MWWWWKTLFLPNSRKIACIKKNIYLLNDFKSTDYVSTIKNEVTFSFELNYVMAKSLKLKS